MKQTAGFSIIELVIAMSLASFVLVGVAMIVAQLARSQMEGIRSGTNTSWSIVSYQFMFKEIEDSSVLAYPSVNFMGADSIVVCKNWSRLQNLPDRRLDKSGSVSVIQYCVDTADPANLLLRRFANVGGAVVCPAFGAPPAACTASPPGWTETGVVALRLERLLGQTVFQRDNSIDGVRLRYVIGKTAPTASVPNPKSIPTQFGIAMQKQYSNTSD